MGCLETPFLLGWPISEAFASESFGDRITSTNQHHQPVTLCFFSPVQWVIVHLDCCETCPGIRSDFFFVVFPYRPCMIWYIYPHFVDLYMVNVGKYTSPMDPSWLLYRWVRLGWGRFVWPKLILFEVLPEKAQKNHGLMLKKKCLAMMISNQLFWIHVPSLKLT